MTNRWIWDRSRQELVPAEEYCAQQTTQRSHFVISDTLDGVLNPADGKRYDSKSKYYRAVRDAGCEIIGNEPMTPKARQYDPGPVAPDIKRAIEQLRSR